MKGMGPSADQLIRQAITEKRLLRFVYGGKLRVAEPHDYGVQKGRLRLLSYQVAGQSSAGHLPAWRWINVKEMSGVSILDQHFAGSRGTSFEKHHLWDELFMRVA